MTKNVDIKIRNSRLEDIPRLEEIFAIARRFMASTGNPNQWAEDYPGEERLREDIASGDSFVCVKDDRIVATFVLRGGDDPTYRIIYDGAWLDDNPYATIHRIASSGEVKGIFGIVMKYALEYYSSIRIDTHADNKVMQHAIEKAGFKYCGIIHCWSGDERLAYQKTVIQESEYERFRRQQIEQFEDDITEGRCYPEMPEGQFVRSK